MWTDSWKSDHHNGTITTIFPNCLTFYDPTVGNGQLWGVTVTIFMLKDTSKVLKGWLSWNSACPLQD